MCFSAGASFGASAILAVAGFFSVKKVEKPSQLFFACIPLIFSLQQFMEGLVWMALNKSYLDSENLAVYIFLFMAQVMWPVWVSLSILLIEPKKKYRRVLKIFLCGGIVLASYLAYCLFFYKVAAVVIPYHIHYDLFFPKEYTNFIGLIYFLTTIMPPFLSTHKRMAMLGLFNLMSFAISFLFFDDYLVSVWCFFSALISWQVFLVMKSINEKMEQKEFKGPE
jgi:hypothetical protein